MGYYSEIQSRWMIALVSGAMSASILFSRYALEAVGFLIVPISALGSFVGLLLGVLSILAKEKKRLLAIPAIVLSLVCPYYFVMSNTRL